MPQEVTLLLRKWSQGDQAAMEELLPMVYDQLRHIAHNHMHREREGHTWKSVDLVHEAYLRLVDQHQADWQDRGHFFGVTAKLMRLILIDHARASHRAKRGGGQFPLPLVEGMQMAEQRSSELIALDDALKALEKLDPAQSRLVELRFFAGLSNKETAEALGVSERTVARDWATARAWLARELTRL